MGAESCSIPNLAFAFSHRLVIADASALDLRNVDVNRLDVGSQPGIRGKAGWRFRSARAYQMLSKKSTLLTKLLVRN